MTQQDYTQHSITPPPELVQEWYEAVGDSTDRQLFWKQRVATQAAQWGADQELEACCRWLGPLGIKGGDTLRRARRPKPPSLKEQALEAAKRFYAQGHECCTDEDVADDFNIIRRALEELPND